MGKSYIENSLKRFLKRKVKITLGLVVTFLITGTVSFSAPNIIGNEEDYTNKWINGIGNEKDYTELKSLLEIGNNKDTDVSFEFDESTSVLTVKHGTNSKKLDLKNQVSESAYNQLINTLKIIKGGENVKLYDKDGNLDKEKTDFYHSYLGQKNTSKIINHAYNDEISVYNGEADFIENKDEDGKKYQYKQIAENGGTVINYNLMETTEQGQLALGKGSIAINYGEIIIAGGYKSDIQKAENGGTVYNFGKIKNINNMNSYNSQTAKNGSKAYNYGVISIFEQQAQTASKDSEIYNYGIIQSTTGTTEQILQSVSENSIAHNYGLLLGKNNIQTGNGKAYNYGTILATENSWNAGQTATYNYNYGFIEGDSTNQAGQEIYNYGIIKGKTGLMISTDKEDVNKKLYNYNILSVKKGGKNQIAIQVKNNNNVDAQNNGLIYSEAESATMISGKVEQNGIIILAENNNKNIFVDGVINNGVVIKKYDNNKIEVDSNNTEILKNGSNKNISFSSEKNNIFIDNYTTNKMTATTELLDSELDNNHITTVIGNDSILDTAIVKNGDLTLNNSTIIGYFEKNGTLLEANGNLTLKGNSVINAITGNIHTGYTDTNLKDVFAVKLAENKTLTIEDNSKVLGGIKGSGAIAYINSNEKHFNTQQVDSMLIRTTANNNITDITLANVILKDSGVGVENAGKLVIDNQSDKKLEGKELSTSITLANNINIQNGIDGSSSANGIELILGDGQISSDETIKIGGEILLGQADDTIIINNILGKYEDKAAVINGNGGDDTVNLKNSNGKHDTFDYTLKNIETLDLGNSSWKIGENASISHDTVIKAGEKTTIQNGTLLGELTGNTENTDFINSKNVNNILENSSFRENAEFQIGIGKDMKLEAGAEYNINDDTAANLEKIKDNVTASAIFTEATEQGKDIRVKLAEEMNIDERYSGIYNEMLENASSNEEILNVLNNSSASEIADTINNKGVLGDTLATTGYKITRDIINSFMSAVNEWDKKANKGEWLANAKYISSDVEYDGANNVKGYDSDINSMVGMIEYGVSENTSYGIALGGGDTEVDVKGAGTLEGDNYYIGAYAKHSVNGFDLVGNLGYTISDLDVDGKGSADSSAVTLGGYIKKDIALTETVRLEPNFAFTYDYIMQDNAEGNGVKVDNKDIHVFEATAGVNIVKGFNIEKGILELKTGVKYSMADINRNEETIISVYEKNINLGDPEVDKTRGTANVGFDYEHETGFGVNGKYEMMWSDSGDDSRITAGVSYRF